MAKIKLDKTTYERAKQLAEVNGYSSVEECVTHLIDQAFGKIKTADMDETVVERLKGLGYIE
jgi:hypothetical protein